MGVGTTACVRWCGCVRVRAVGAWGRHFRRRGELPRFLSLMGSWRGYAGALVVFAHGAPRRGMRMRPPAVGAGGPGRLSQGGGPTAAEGPGGAGNVPAPVTR